MKRFSSILAIPALLLFLGLILAEPIPVLTAHGIVEKVEKDSLTLEPRLPDGKFGKAITLKLTGTSDIALVSMQKRGDKLVPVQKKVDAKDLSAKQPIAVIYTGEKEGSVLLSAVVQSEK